MVTEVLLGWSTDELYPLVICYIAIENHHLWSLPEATGCVEMIWDELLDVVRAVRSWRSCDFGQPKISCQAAMARIKSSGFHQQIQGFENKYAVKLETDSASSGISQKKHIKTWSLAEIQEILFTIIGHLQMVVASPFCEGPDPNNWCQGRGVDAADWAVFKMFMILATCHSMILAQVQQPNPSN